MQATHTAAGASPAAGEASGRIAKKNPGKKQHGVLAFCLVCTVPALVLFAFFVIYPVINMFITSTYEWTGSFDGVKTFVGFDNYEVLFTSPRFWKSFTNTLFLIVLVTIVTIVLALYFAAVLSKGKTKGKAFFRIVFYIPNILSIVVISSIFSAILAPDYGIIGALSKLFGGHYTGWLADKNKVMWIIGVAMIWQAVGYYMVMYVAGMDSIDDSLYEAANLDGAGKARQFFVITIPMTWQVIRVTLTFFIISTINMSFLFVDSMTQGAADSNVLLTYMYYNSYANSTYGYGMAVAAVVFVFAYGLALIVQALTTPRDEREAGRQRRAKV